MKRIPPRLTRRRTKQLLDRGDPSHGDALSVLLARATDPVSSPLKGEDHAVAQFRAAHLAAVPSTESSVMTRLTRKIAAVPVAALGAGALILGGGGLALAASQGVVPFTGHDNRSDKAPAAEATVNPGQAKAATKTPSSSDDASNEATPAAKPTATPAGTPSPSLRGLCKAYQAGALAKPKTSPAFAALTTAAGGNDQVASYCVTLLGTPKAKPSQAATPTHPAKPSHPAKPTQAANPTKPAKPSQAATPTRKAHPSQAATPAKKAKPATQGAE